ncbi:hypothetical protein AJ80_00516 [Polytolypa hystricis UAMH7299]|uniref:Protein BFR2 n=1 Tax=Polytolypa hystricis (strain UAMH7299) TaxID=1447883 RepID=A0A2B7Z3A7_POLH7|nr:hypothetical protein AJ80_00516 [Polytolypa hystricis UAMH7299]
MSVKSRPAKSLAEQIAELEDPTPKDFDPEDLSDGGADSDDDSAGVSDKDDAAGREHYEAVGKSKLRKPETVTLGRQYAGAKVSRDALEADESGDDDDDPFRKAEGDEESEGSEDGSEEDEVDLDALAEAGSDGEIESDEAFGESDEERFKDFKFRASKFARPHADEEGGDEFGIDGMPSDEESDNDEDMDEDEDEGSGDEEDDEIGDVSGSEDDEEEDEAEAESDASDLPDDRAELRRLMASDHKTVAASISQAVKADAAKGIAIKKQRLAFDALLNARMKLQKGLTAVNGLPAANNDEEVDQQSIKSAEAAALTLWSTLEDLRHALADAHSTNTAPKKRKRDAAPSSSTSSETIWNRMKEIEAQSLPRRRAVLDKWSQKTRGSRAALPTGRGSLLNSRTAAHQTITAVLDAQIASEIGGDRGSKRARTYESESKESNPTTNGIDTAAEIYDDSVFYQSLLRDLVEQRMASTNGGLDAVDMQFSTRLSIHATTGMRKDKVKRPVDTKASKGRKMRYTVHEKLQNFMAPEERGSWGGRARDEFFASLLGRNAREVLGEESEDEAADAQEEDVEEGGLRLFRS